MLTPIHASCHSQSTYYCYLVFLKVPTLRLTFDSSTKALLLFFDVAEISGQLAAPQRYLL